MPLFECSSKDIFKLRKYDNVCRYTSLIWKVPFCIDILWEVIQAKTFYIINIYIFTNIFQINFFLPRIRLMLMSNTFRLD